MKTMFSRFKLFKEQQAQPRVMKGFKSTDSVFNKMQLNENQRLKSLMRQTVEKKLFVKFKYCYSSECFCSLGFPAVSLVFDIFH